MRRLLALVAWCLPSLAAAQIEVVSSRPDAVSVTIYRDLFALITETRTVDLPAEPVTLAFDNVVETLIPASAVVSGVERGLLERNYDYERLGPASLLRRSIGREVMLTRVLPGSGKVVQTRATIAAANDGGVTLRTPDGYEALGCSGLPEGLIFEEIPGELNPTPRLSVRLAAGAAGRRTVQLSYIAQGFAWRTDYVAHLDADGTRLDLTGWVTLRNLTRASLQQAQVQVVAGALHLLDEGDRGSSMLSDFDDFGDETHRQDAREGRLAEMQEEQEYDIDLMFLRGCYPVGVPRHLNSRRENPYGVSKIHAEDVEEVLVTGLRGSLLPPEALADYHLYRVPWPTDLNARQTKQAVFLEKPQVKVERFYSVRFDPEDLAYGDEEDVARELRPRVKLAFRNVKSAGLGEPLPSGLLRVFERDDGREVFAGEARLGDQPVGVPVELEFAQALDFVLDFSVDGNFNKLGKQGRQESEVTLHVRNSKPQPVTLELRQELPRELVHASVVKASRRSAMKHGDVTWRLQIAPHAAESLGYTLRTTGPLPE